MARKVSTKKAADGHVVGTVRKKGSSESTSMPGKAQHPRTGIAMPGNRKSR